VSKRANEQRSTPAPPAHQHHQHIAHQHTSTPAHQHTSTPAHQQTSKRANEQTRNEHTIDEHRSTRANEKRAHYRRVNEHTSTLSTSKRAHEQTSTRANGHTSKRAYEQTSKRANEHTSKRAHEQTSTINNRRPTTNEQDGRPAKSQPSKIATKPLNALVTHGVSTALLFPTCPFPVAVAALSGSALDPRLGPVLNASGWRLICFAPLSNAR
jgi:hypothetical protein